MIIIARPFPYNHVCSHYCSQPDELYYELIEDTFENTCIHNKIRNGLSVKVSLTQCKKCGTEYYFIEGMNTSVIIDKNNTIIRGYISE